MDDLRGFRDWLRGHKSSDVIGFTRDPEYCPVATYMRDLGHSAPSVSRHYQLCGDDIADNPAWMTEFIIKIDRLCKPNDPITAGMALSVLLHIEGELIMAPLPSMHLAATLPVEQLSMSGPSQSQA